MVHHSQIRTTSEFDVDPPADLAEVGGFDDAALGHLDLGLVGVLARGGVGEVRAYRALVLCAEVLVGAARGLLGHGRPRVIIISSSLRIKARPLPNKHDLYYFSGWGSKGGRLPPVRKTGRLCDTWRDIDSRSSASYDRR